MRYKTEELASTAFQHGHQYQFKITRKFTVSSDLICKSKTKQQQKTTKVATCLIFQLNKLIVFHTSSVQDTEDTKSK